MKIYAVADIHGKKQRMAAIGSAIERFRPDITIIAGDITQYRKAEQVIDRLDRLNTPMFAVRGNTDREQVEALIRQSRNIRLLTPDPVKMEDFSFSGTGGTLPLPFASRICLKEKPALEALGKGLPCPCPEHILVVHPPPRGVLDKVGNRFSAGSVNLKQFIEKFQPALVFCGHIHEQPGIQVLGQTLVVNCAMGKIGGGVVMEYGKNSPIRVDLLKPDGSSGMSTQFDPDL